MAPRRSAAACMVCHQRKTKCDLVIRGPPCSACTADARPASACVQRPNKRYRRRNEPHQNNSELHHQENLILPATGNSQNSQVSPPQSIASGSRATYQPVRIDFSDDSAVIISLAAKDAAGFPCEVDFKHNLDACHALDSADHAYLEAKGVFALPTTDVCDKLIRGFFSHVHPWFPVVDAADFLIKYANGGSTNVDLLLLWTVLMAGSESADPGLAAMAGFAGRLRMADAFYIRAKILYDMKELENKEVCTQAMLLFSRYHKNFPKRWHAVGIARWLCQFPTNFAVRLHGSESATKKALQLRRWHCCLANDAWEAIASGCPLKITRSESQVPALSVGDILGELNSLDSIIRQRFISVNIDRLIKYAVSYFKSVSIVRDSLYKASGPDNDVASAVEIDAWIRDLTVIEQDIVGDLAQDIRSSDECLQITAYRFHIHHGATHIALLRPYLFVTPSGLAAQEKPMWECKMKRDMTAVAGKVISTLETVIGARLLSHLGHGLPCIMVPVAQYCLIQINSQEESEHKIAQHRFDSCMIIIDELRKIDGNALTLYKLLRAARSDLVPNGRQGSSAPDTSVVISDQDRPSMGFDNIAWEDWDTAMTTVIWDGFSSLEST